MAKEKDRKQIGTLDVQNKLCVLRQKVNLLFDAIAPMTDEEHWEALTHAGAEGAGVILREIADELKEIETTEIVQGYHESEPLPLRKEA